jgi:hypothetical protein
VAFFHPSIAEERQMIAPADISEQHVRFLRQGHILSVV